MIKNFSEYSNEINQLILYPSNSNSEINRENFDVYGGEIVNDEIFILLRWWNTWLSNIKINDTIGYNQQYLNAHLVNIITN